MTNVSDSTRLSRKTAMALYAMRWGIEMFYRSFKQTLERRKMRSDSAPLAKIELNMTTIGLLLLMMLTTRQPMRQVLSGTQRREGLLHLEC